MYNKKQPNIHRPNNFSSQRIAHRLRHGNGENRIIDTRISLTWQALNELFIAQTKLFMRLTGRLEQK